MAKPTVRLKKKTGPPRKEGALRRGFLLHLRLPQPTWYRIHVTSIRRGISASEWVRQAIEEQFKREDIEQ